jgi:hypothetical protein
MIDSNGWGAAGIGATGLCWLQKNAGLAAATLVSAPNPVSQVLW